LELLVGLVEVVGVGARELVDKELTGTVTRVGLGFADRFRGITGTAVVGCSIFVTGVAGSWRYCIVCMGNGDGGGGSCCCCFTGVVITTPGL